MEKNKKMVDEMIHPDYRKDALEIISFINLLKNSDSIYSELEKYYKEDSGNLFCLHIDYIKNELVKNNILKEDDNNF